MEVCPRMFVATSEKVEKEILVVGHLASPLKLAALMRLLLLPQRIRRAAGLEALRLTCVVTSRKVHKDSQDAGLDNIHSTYVARLPQSTKQQPWRSRAGSGLLHLRCVVILVGGPVGTVDVGTLLSLLILAAPRK